MKDNKEVISEFNEYVNMTASELEKWLESDDSTSAGWSKDGDGEGESVGHDSGKKIVEILKSNPDKTPDKYTDDQLQHMRKVASYCKRHLAQEASGNEEKDPEEVKKTKSYISLKNWGHDFLKAQGKQSGSANGGGSKSGSKKKNEDKEENKEEKDEAKEENGEEEEKEEEEEGSKEEEDEKEEEEEGDKDKKAGDKRKKSGQQNGSNKKQETRQTRSSDKKENEDKDKEEAEDDQDGEDDGEDEGENGDSGGKSGKNGPKKGDTVSWNWGSGNPQGKVLDVKEDKATITTKNGNEVSRDGDSEDPAVVLDTGKSKAIKSAHELN
ncbi:hypothetical protein N0V93_005900 [Gnomoniopsis smithogilvyi]|uniref:Hypervirulence associated protein TUDOR domain-containing protein n=1 Tax=Gnomoniopsis smithogilvyi TaxID=1191159 RepID=A0A9W8YWG1_9PEZI|nr:hypothetical protein N0V93_005900 [Gnomoniopsis smithogilvyi]